MNARDRRGGTWGKHTLCAFSNSSDRMSVITSVNGKPREPAARSRELYGFLLVCDRVYSPSGLSNSLFSGFCCAQGSRSLNWKLLVLSKGIFSLVFIDLTSCTHRGREPFLFWRMGKIIDAQNFGPRLTCFRGKWS